MPGLQHAWHQREHQGADEGSNSARGTGASIIDATSGKCTTSLVPELGAPAFLTAPEPLLWVPTPLRTPVLRAKDTVAPFAEDTSISKNISAMAEGIPSRCSLMETYNLCTTGN